MRFGTNLGGANSFYPQISLFILFYFIFFRSFPLLGSASVYVLPLYYIIDFSHKILEPVTAVPAWDSEIPSWPRISHL